VLQQDGAGPGAWRGSAIAATSARRSSRGAPAGARRGAPAEAEAEESPGGKSGVSWGALGAAGGAGGGAGWAADTAASEYRGQFCKSPGALSPGRTVFLRDGPVESGALSPLQEKQGLIAQRRYQAVAGRVAAPPGTAEDGAFARRASRGSDAPSPAAGRGLVSAGMQGRRRRAGAKRLAAAHPARLLAVGQRDVSGDPHCHPTPPVGSPGGRATSDVQGARDAYHEGRRRASMDAVR